MAILNGKSKSAVPRTNQGGGRRVAQTGIEQVRWFPLKAVFGRFFLFLFSYPPEAEAAYNESLVHCTLLLLLLRSHHPFPSSPFFIHPRIIKGSHLFWKEEEEEKEENFVSRFGSKKGEVERPRATFSSFAFRKCCKTDGKKAKGRGEGKKWKRRKKSSSLISRLVFRWRGGS